MVFIDHVVVCIALGFGGGGINRDSCNRIFVCAGRGEGLPVPRGGVLVVFIGRGGGIAITITRGLGDFGATGAGGSVKWAFWGHGDVQKEGVNGDETINIPYILHKADSQGDNEKEISS